MDVNGAIDAFKGVATAHPYLALAILLFIIGALIRGKASLVFYILGGLALLEEFSLFDVFVSFLKDVPSLIDKLLSVFGGG
ncbi:MAG: t26-9p [Thermococcus sp.]|uniref:t26-9p n=1 Tax=Thermococcus sp. TaxID=35749 RepID=UPI001D24B29B|nr:t26-9p [Thermococcus sp.]MBO8175190.1 t26-9p [Thermococcus sp.]